MSDLDLFVLVPDGDYKQGIEGLLSSRRNSLGIRDIRFRVESHPRHDPACFRESPALLRSQIGQADYVLVLFDHEGSGQESRSVGELEDDLRRRLVSNGWKDRSEVVVVPPELEIWVWTQASSLENVLDWDSQDIKLKQWLEEQGLWLSDDIKPARPKEALRKALRKAGLHPSSSIFRQIAEKVGFQDCTDASFRRFHGVLNAGFRSRCQ